MAILGFVGWLGPYGASAFAGCAALGIAILASAPGAPVPRPVRVPARRR